MSTLPEIRRLLQEAEAILAPARLREAPHPIVPIAIASNRVRDALYLLEREPAEESHEAAAARRRRTLERVLSEEVSHAVSQATADRAVESGPERPERRPR